MLFAYSDHYKCRLDLGGESCLKHVSHRHPGVGTALLFQVKRGEKDGTRVYQSKGAEI